MANYFFKAEIPSKNETSGKAFRTIIGSFSARNKQRAKEFVQEEFSDIKNIEIFESEISKNNTISFVAYPNEKEVIYVNEDTRTDEDKIHQESSY